MSILRYLVAIACIGVLAACAPPPPAPNPVASKPASLPKPELTGLQSALNRHGVPLHVPQKGKAILVNIPSYELIALEDGEEVFRSRVIVGAPGRDRETPILDTFTSVARFLPTWRPTPTMIRTGAYTDGVRPPGRRNPLGLVALRLEPGMLVYLHDTNKPQLFDRDKRALSWGCVRVDGIERLITWALDMEQADYAALTSGRRTFDVPTYDMIPVMLRYYTAFPDAAGNLRYHDDIYGQGETILRRSPEPGEPREPVTMAPVTG